MHSNDQSWQGVGVFEWPPCNGNANVVEPRDPKEAFARHLASIGFELNAPREVVLEKLRRRMGEQRFKEFFSGSTGQSAHAHEEFYTRFSDLIEANLMRSLDPNVTLESSFHLYQRAGTQLRPGTRAIELGCWTGGLASFIASRHPQCVVIGVDLGQKIVDECNRFYKLPNLSFHRWNYRWGKPEEVEPADVLLCSLGVVHHLPDNSALPDPDAVRRSHEYKIQLEHATGYFSVWRSAAKPGALLYAVLRLRLFPRFLAWIDAAQDAGWTPLLDRLWHVDLPAEQAALPGLAFRAEQSERLPEQAILDRWSWFYCRSDVYAHLKGGVALMTYRRLHGKAPLATRKYRRDGLLICDEIGVNDEAGYVFTHNAHSEYRLLIVSHKKANELAAGVSVPNSSTPITDEGRFQEIRAADPRSTGRSPFFAGAPFSPVPIAAAG